VAHSLASTGAAFGILFVVVGISFAIVGTNPVMIPGKPWIGITGSNLTPAIAQAIGTSEQSGFLVVQVLPNSPAEKAGIRGSDRTITVGNEQVHAGGDVIVELDGKPITSGEQIQANFQQRHVGDIMHFTIVRGSVTMQIPVTLEEKPT
jgi:serine protease Do